MYYEKLEDHFRRLNHLQQVSAIICWDEAVIMPQAAGPSRADAIATLQEMIHRMKNEPALQDWLQEARHEADQDQLDAWQKANLREMGRVHRRASCLTGDLVQAMSRAQFRCEQAWRTLRYNNDWSSLEPLLKRVVQLKREMAARLAEALGSCPYDALMDGYEPGAKSHTVDLLFRDIRSFLPDFTEQVLYRQGRQRVVVPEGPFAIENQRQLAQRLMRIVGFDEKGGRLDVSHHPFCGGVPTDVRITTRYDEADFRKALMAALHETGHAKYEQGLPAAWLEQPVGRSRSMGIHESQSLLQEMQVSRSREFWKFAAPIVRQELADRAGAQPEAFETENLYRLYNRVERGLIRVDADEVTYPGHIVLRYDIERRLIDGRIEVEDIPEVWDTGMQDSLDLSTAGNYRDGCMQDVHWPAGAFGYFPTYLLGAMAAAQIFAALARELPGVLDDIAAGRFQELNRWLQEKIWSKGSLLSVDQLMREATGETLNPRDFKQHLQRRYLSE